jgi:T5orf172 domain
MIKDKAGRRITDPLAGPLFGDDASEDDVESGTIYVLRSKSDHPTIAANRGVIHKIGVTGGDVAARIAGAKTDPTFLFADVEVVATYELFNVNRAKLEALIHNFFSAARLDLEMNDRFGAPFKPREWFLVPLFAINEVVERIRDGSITEFRYDVSGARLVARK